VERARIAADLVLVGGGHAHVQVLRRFAMSPPRGVRATVVLDRAEAIYSGMLPGLVAGDYAAHELAIDVVPLARRAGARVVLAAATRLDVGERRIELEGRPPLRFDVASLDVGGSLRDLELPGVREHALATRPIRGFVDRLEARLARALATTGAPRIAVVGGGAAGVELAFCLEARLRRAGRAAELTLFEVGPALLAGLPASLVRRVREEAHRRGIALRARARATRLEASALWLGDERCAADLVVWASGAAPLPWLADPALKTDPQGFLRVRDTLQLDGCDDVFAAGDCASLAAAPWVPKAGVYAVREGPVLEANLRARLAGGALRRYRPQRDFLALLNLGDGRALGSKWGRAASGRAVWRLKDRIDRRFVRRFQVLDPEGRPAPGFPAPMADAMECGGCAAKVGPDALAAALARLAPAPADDSVLLGLARPDDAAAFRTPRGDVLLASADAFPAFCDDAWLVGRVAAINAVSDLYAKGGRPRHALALVGVPEAEPARAQETLFQVLAGVRAALDPLGVTLLGGHSTRGDALWVGLSVTGELEGLALALAGLRPGDRLLLTKPLGTGVVLAADMQGRARGDWLAAATRSMLRPNAEAARVARASAARACTDVSGFALAGHLAGLLRASRVSARIDLDALPALPGALELLAEGFRSSFHEQNVVALRDELALAPELESDPRCALLFDPQTSGGLLFGVPAGSARRALEALRAAGDGGAAVIGEVESRSGVAALARFVRGGQRTLLDNPAASDYETLQAQGDGAEVS
jgi:selenide,water dikinase